MSDDDFDIEGWISSAKLPERTIALCARGDLIADHRIADDNLKASRVTDDRMGADPHHDLAQQVRDLEDQIRASTKVFRVRALTAAEQDKARGDSVKDGEGNPEFGDFSALWLATSTIKPAVSVQQVKALRDRLGEGQYLSWFNASSEATNQRVSVPFSLAASGILGQSAS